MLTFACVLRSGGVYNAEWVRKLRDGVARNLSAEHRFVCLSDVDVPCERIALETDWPRWWGKLELFRRGLFDGPVFYADLDTVITGPLDEIVAYPHRFTMAHEYNRPHLLCSTAMAWNGDYSFIYDAMKDEGQRVYYDERLPNECGRIGDQAFIEDQLIANGIKSDTFRDLFGERSVASYKIHECQERPPHEAAMVAFHGRPKMSDLKTGWVPDLWR